MFSNSTVSGIRRLLVLSVFAAAFVGQSNGQAVTQQGVTQQTDSSSTQPTAAWVRYTIKDREFSVLLPTTPAMSSYRDNPNPANKHRLRNITAAYSQGVVYAIYVAERKQSLEEFIEQLRYWSPGTFKREIKVEGFSGKEYVSERIENKCITQYFITDRYLYSFAACGSPLGKPDVGMPRFFESIRLGPTAAGVLVVEGPGYQPAVDPTVVTEGTDVRVLSGKEVTRKALVAVKPEPTYTENARMNGAVGKVVIRCVFSSSGVVKNIKLVSGLSYGLSEQALDAARKIRFVPASKGGQFVSMWYQLEYNFNLY